MPETPPQIPRDSVRKLWLHRQGLIHPFSRPLCESTFQRLLGDVGALQLDSVNVVDRAHHLTLWSRFGTYDRSRLEPWIWRDRQAFEYWGHEASILPMHHLPYSLRAMKNFEMRGSWWAQRQPSRAVVRHVMKRIRDEGPLESRDFQREEAAGAWWGWKAEKQALEILWHRGVLATAERRSFRRVYDLAERVFPETRPATTRALQDRWLEIGMQGNGITAEPHLDNYFTSPRPHAAERRAILARALKKGALREVRVADSPLTWYARPFDLDALHDLPDPRGTTLICPFDSLLWQRRRAEDLLDFRYRIEIYTPPPQRVFGYYVMPILHEGRLLGRLDPKLHRKEKRLEIKAIHLEPGVSRHQSLDRGLARALTSLAEFTAARDISLPREWKTLAG